MLLDEPMNGPDLESNLLLGRLLRELAEAGCVVVTSHVLPFLTAACDRVHVLGGGLISLSATRERFPELKGRLVTLETFTLQLGSLDGLETTSSRSSCSLVPCALPSCTIVQQGGCMWI